MEVIITLYCYNNEKKNDRNCRPILFFVVTSLYCYCKYRRLMYDNKINDDVFFFLN